MCPLCMTIKSINKFVMQNSGWQAKLCSHTFLGRSDKISLVIDDEEEVVPENGIDIGWRSYQFSSCAQQWIKHKCRWVHKSQHYALMVWAQCHAHNGTILTAAVHIKTWYTPRHDLLSDFCDFWKFLAIPFTFSLTIKWSSSSLQGYRVYGTTGPGYPMDLQNHKLRSKPQDLSFMSVIFGCYTLKTLKMSRLKVNIILQKWATGLNTTATQLSLPVFRHRKYGILALPRDWDFFCLLSYLADNNDFTYDY